MSLVSGAIKNLFGGVSQAPPEQRDPSEFTEQENALPIYGQKLGRRPPTLHIAKMSSTSLTGAFEHRFGNYTILVVGTVLRVFETLTGIEQTVVNNLTNSYLNGPLKATTIGDTTFIVNTSVVTAYTSNPGSALVSAHVSIVTGDFETTYTIVIAGTSYSYTTPVSTAAGAKAASTTQAICSQLATVVAAAPGMTVTNFGSTLYIRRTDAADFTISTSDGLGNAGMVLIKGTAKQFSDLPKYGKTGTVVEVVGEATTPTDNYYVQCLDASGSTVAATGVQWREVPWGAGYVGYTTMPIRVVKSGTTFTVEYCPWPDRPAGDNTTNPFPSFMGSAISDVFVYQGRLGFISKEKVFLTRAGDLYNLFRTTVTQILADDPIDISGSVSGVTRLDWAMVWNEAVYLFSDGRTQFVLAGSREGLTSRTVSLSKVSEYRYSAVVRPHVAGERMFFVALKSGVPRIMDYHMKGYQKTHSALDLGLHVPTYFKGNPKSLVADDALGLLFFRTDQGLYCYKYHVVDDERVQGAWSKWTFASNDGGSLIAIDMNDGVVSLVQSYTDGVYLNQVILDPQRLSFFQGYNLYGGALTFDGAALYDGGLYGFSYQPVAAHLDRYWSTSAGVFDGFRTTWTLPYTVARDDSEGFMVVTRNDPSVILPSVRLTANTISVDGNYSTALVRIGLRYPSRFTLSTLYKRDRQSGEAETRGRLQLRWVRLHYVDAVGFAVVIESLGRTTRLQRFAFTSPQSGNVLIPIQLRNLDCTISVGWDTAGADAFTGIEWQGTYHDRAAH